MSGWIIEFQILAGIGVILCGWAIAMLIRGRGYINRLRAGSVALSGLGLIAVAASFAWTSLALGAVWVGLVIAAAWMKSRADRYSMSMPPKTDGPEPQVGS